LSKPPKFEGKRGTTLVIWEVRFRSWAEVKGISEALMPSFDSKLPSKQYNVIDNMDPSQKAQGITRKQNAVTMDALV
jgi:hypothetical protein